MQMKFTTTSTTVPSRPRPRPLSTTATKTVLVTGATRGIGLKFVEVYIQLGWNVIAAARDPTKADDLRALAPYKIVQLDSADEDSILRAVKELDTEAVDLLVNNAGVLIDGDMDTTTKVGMLKQFDVNCIGTFLVTRASVPHLKRAVASHGAATAAQLSSYLGSVTLNNGTFHGMFGYRASKAALNMVNASLAIELKGDNIAVFSLHPGLVTTDLNPIYDDIITDTSVRALMGVLDKLTLADSGKFYDYNGENLPW